ncbi:hypothetical protein KY284_026320 [Solanum tuberosum]|nr:hypothetical protein KY284_026320 [Solanum tuberosum]
MEASYECYLRNGVLHFYLLLSKFRPCIVKLWGSNPDPLAFRSMNIVGMVGGKPEATLPPDASSTLFVEGLPADCTRREIGVTYIPHLLEVTKKLSWYQKDQDMPEPIP